MYTEVAALAGIVVGSLDKHKRLAAIGSLAQLPLSDELAELCVPILAPWVAKESSDVCAENLLKFMESLIQNCSPQISQHAAPLLLTSLSLRDLGGDSEQVQSAMMQLITVLEGKTALPASVAFLLAKLDLDQIDFALLSRLEFPDPAELLQTVQTVVLPALVHRKSPVRIRGLELLDVLIRKFPFKTTFPIICMLTGRTEEEHVSIPISDFFESKVRVNFLGHRLADHSVSVRKFFFKLLATWVTQLEDRSDIESHLAPYLLSGLWDRDDSIQVQVWADISGPTSPARRITSAPTLSASAWVRKNCRQYISCLLTDTVDFGTCTNANSLNLLRVTLIFIQDAAGEYLVEILLYLGKCRTERKLVDEILSILASHISPASRWWDVVKSFKDPGMVRTLLANSSDVDEGTLEEIVAIADEKLLDLILAKHPPSIRVPILLRAAELGISAFSLPDIHTAEIDSALHQVLSKFEKRLCVDTLTRFVDCFPLHLEARGRIATSIRDVFPQLNRAQKSTVARVLVEGECDVGSTLLTLLSADMELVLPILCRHLYSLKDENFLNEAVPGLLTRFPGNERKLDHWFLLSFVRMSGHMSEAQNVELIRELSARSSYSLTGFLLCLICLHQAFAQSIDVETILPVPSSQLKVSGNACPAKVVEFIIPIYLGFKRLTDQNPEPEASIKITELLNPEPINVEASALDEGIRRWFTQVMTDCIRSDPIETIRLARKWDAEGYLARSSLIQTVFATLGG